MRNKKRLGWIIPIIIVALIAGYFFCGWELLTRMHPDRVANNVAELADRVNADLDAGKQSGIVFVSKDVSASDIDRINDYICSMNGMVDRYSVAEKLPQGTRVRFKYEISDNYYVYEHIAHGKNLPGDRPMAKQLCEAVEEIINTQITDTMSDYEKELALHDYLVKNCSYGMEEDSKSYAYRAYGALVQHIAVCNGYAEALALLYSCVGINNKIVTGYAEEELHAWNRVQIDGNWYMVDATWDDPLPDRGDFAGHAYFNVTDDILSMTHTWEEEDGEKCTVLDANYFYVNQLVANYEEFCMLANREISADVSKPFEIVLKDYSEAYDLNFLYDIPGVNRVSYTPPIPYGSYQLVTFYMNEE